MTRVRVDAKATAALAADLVDRGMRGVLVCGTTGEAGKLSDAERVELISAVRGGRAARRPGAGGYRRGHRGRGGAAHRRGR